MSERVLSLKETGSAAPGFGASTPAIAPNKTAASAGHRGFGESVDALSCPLIARGCTAVTRVHQEELADVQTVCMPNRDGGEGDTDGAGDKGESDGGGGDGGGGSRAKEGGVHRRVQVRQVQAAAVHVLPAADAVRG